MRHIDRPARTSPQNSANPDVRAIWTDDRQVPKASTIPEQSNQLPQSRLRSTSSRKFMAKVFRQVEFGFSSVKAGVAILAIVGTKCR